MKSVFSLAFLGCLLCVRGYADDTGILGKPPAFSAIVLEAVAMRSELHAGEYNYKITYKESAKDLATSVQEGVYAYDDRTGKSLHVSFVSIRNPEEPNNATTRISGGVYSPSPDLSLLIGNRLEQSTSVAQSSIKSTSRFMPFEFRSLGFGFMSDYKRNAGFERMITTYLALDDSKVRNVELADRDRPENSSSNLKTYQHGLCMLSVDLARDNWPIRQRVVQNNNVKTKFGTWEEGPDTLISGTDIKLFEFERRWLPFTAKVMDAKSFYFIEFTWKSINQPIDDKQLTFERANALAANFENERFVRVSEFLEGK